jgi:hypothetical protein
MFDAQHLFENGRWQTPCHSTFNEYKKKLDVKTLEELLNGKYLRSRIKKIYRRLAENQRVAGSTTQNRVVVQVNIDGKDICNTADKDHSTNVTSIQIMMDGILVKTLIVENESSWIKTDLIPTLEDLRKNIPDVQLFFTGDMIYRRPNLIEYLKKNGDSYLFKVKYTTKNNGLYHELVKDFSSCKLNDKVLTTTTVKKQGGLITTDRIECFPVNHDKADNVILIDRTIAPINKPIKKKGKAKKTDSSTATKKMTCEKILLMSNCGKISTLKDLEKILEYKRLHWKVETYHSYRDQIYNEDRYHKSRLLAAISARILDFALVLTDKILTSEKQFKLRYPAKKREPMRMAFLARHSILFPQ